MHTGKWNAPSLFRVEVVDYSRMRLRGELRWVTWGAARGLTLTDGHSKLAEAKGRPLRARLVRERDGEVVAGETAGSTTGVTDSPLAVLGPGGDFVREVRTQ